MKPAHEYDVIALGSGAAGMCAALVAQCEGLRAIVIEKTEYFGGTTALSGGSAWIPLAKPTGNTDSREQVLTYLRKVIGSHARMPLIEAFVDHGAKAVSYLEAHTELQFSGRQLSPDYWPEVEGAMLGGRSIDPLPLDGRLLDKYFPLLRNPRPEALFMGMMVTRSDVDHLLNASRHWNAAAHVAALLWRLTGDRLRGQHRGSRLVLGNALAARLLKSCLDRQVTLWNRCPALELTESEGRVSGVVVERTGQRVWLAARRGVVLATGGFPASIDWRRKLLPSPTGFWTAGNEANEGEGLRMGLSQGGMLAADNAHNAFWAPVSILTRPDGTIARFPHLMLDRYKPGFIAVNKAGKRFVNEANSYHAFVAAMLETSSLPAYLICDRLALRRYGLGMVRPWPGSRARFIRAGYLVEAPTLRELAARLDIEGDQLDASVERYNHDAAEGVDREFGKGSNAYNRYKGEAGHLPNPCLAPVTVPPFYAVQVLPGDLGTSCGLLTDTHARVLNGDGHPVPGLYACGNDMNSIMRGAYPGPGITLGPALVFAYLAAMHMCGRADGKPAPVLLETENPMLYELRFYAINVGRMPDIHERMRTHLPALFERHHIPVVGRWSVTAGPSVPMFIWLIAWPDAVARSEGWAGFYVDPDWTRVRRETNAGSEMNEGSDVFLLTPHAAWKPDPALRPNQTLGGLHELIIQKVAMGQATEAARFLADHTLPALARVGAKVFGIMDLSSGSGLPAIALFVAWPDYSVRLKGWTALEEDADRRSAIKAQREAAGRPLLGRAAVYLLEPAAYALPLASLGMQAEPAVSRRS